MTARRFDRLPRTSLAGSTVPVATTLRSRLLGLAGLDRGEAGPGLLIPGCRSVHTFGMRFPLDVVFLDADGGEIASRRGVGPRRLVGDRRAAAVLELPSGRSAGRPRGTRGPARGR